MDEEIKQKVIVYVDGFNFYNGLKAKGWRKYYWLDIIFFFQQFMKPNQELVAVKYFSAKSLEPEKAKRQGLWFSANKNNPLFSLIMGKYTSKEVSCYKCGHTHSRNEEKQTDVSIAIHLLTDVVKEKCDVSILVSADSDLVPPIEAIREINPDHQIYVYFPPLRRSSDLLHICTNKIDLERYESRFKKSLLPDSVVLKNGFVANKPAHWDAGENKPKGK